MFTLTFFHESYYVYNSVQIDQYVFSLQSYWSQDS